MFGVGVVAILFLAGENHVSDKHISSHADVGVCVTVCMTVRVFLSATNCVPGVNGASGGIRWGRVLSRRVSRSRGALMLLQWPAGGLCSVSH